MATEVQIGGSLEIEDVVSVARGGAQVRITDAAVPRIRASRDFVEQLIASNQSVYGLTTGFGKLANIRIAHQDLQALQRNLLLSHAFGTGPLLSTEVVRAMLLLRAQSLSLGYSGVRLEVIKLILACLNKGVHPHVPSQGSVGASGDLAPLAHMSITLIGEGIAEYQGESLPAREALKRAGLKPIVLEAKEGLALINGTQAMTGIGCLVVHDASTLAAAADIAGAMTLEALKGTLRAFDSKVSKVRSHPGAVQVSDNVRRIGADSSIHQSHVNCEKVQDPYSLRCIPQVHGASRDALQHVREVLEREINSVTDNPLIFANEQEVISAGNFHGQPVALAMDYAKLAIAELANISERRVAFMQDSSLSGLPAFLAESGGLHSGLMITQYTAASLVSENKVLVHPASADSIPTSANQEDHVSMGTIAARQAAMILENARTVVAIELLNAAQALEFHKPLEPGPGTKAALGAIRERVAFANEDRLMTDDLAAMKDLVESGKLRASVERQVGKLF
jgi:histidine ammonia-lyase